MMGRNGRKQSLRALDAAWDGGIRFFDTARSYGYGESEVLLGQFLRGRRDQAIVATKFGILASPQPVWKKLARAAARGVLKYAPWMHRTLQKSAASQFTHHQFTLPVLQQSLDQSLRALGVDYIDILFLHAAPASVLQQEDLLEAMQRLVESGKIRLAGLSSDPDIVQLALQQQTPQLRAMQFPCNVFDVSAAKNLAHFTDGSILLVSNHPYGGAARIRQCRQVIADLTKKESLEQALREKIQSLDDDLMADIVLNTILRDTGIHVVIPAMMNPRHIQANIRAVSDSRFTNAEIRSIRSALADPIFPDL